MTDEAPEQLLFPAPSNRPGARRYVEPDWPALVREMKQAEAERSRRAKVISALGEEQAAQKLLEAAKILQPIPQAMQLRYLTALFDISNERTSTIVFPFPIEILRAAERHLDGHPVAPGGRWHRRLALAPARHSQRPEKRDLQAWIVALYRAADGAAYQPLVAAGLPQAPAMPARKPDPQDAPRERLHSACCTVTSKCAGTGGNDTDTLAKVMSSRP